MRSSPRRFASIAHFIVHYFLFLFNSRRVFICIPRLQRRQRHFSPPPPQNREWRRFPSSASFAQWPTRSPSNARRFPPFLLFPIGETRLLIGRQGNPSHRAIGEGGMRGRTKNNRLRPLRNSPFSYTPLGFFLLPFPTYPFFLWSPFASNLPSSSFPTHSPVLGKENS